jgi:hypothetical protein
MLLYHPSDEEISSTLGPAACRAPSLRSRLDRAGALLRAGALQLEGGQWRCAGSRDLDVPVPDAPVAGAPAEHQLYTLDFGACDCPDCATGRAVVGGMAFCQHLLALQAYRCILLDHLRGRIIGELPQACAKEEARRAANAALLLSPGADPQHPALFAYAHPRHLRPLCICSLYCRGGELAFPSEAHMGAFAEWLAKAQPLPAELQALVLYRRLRTLGFDEEAAAAAADSLVDPAVNRESEMMPVSLRMAA